jgi:hypothetical protein
MHTLPLADEIFLIGHDENTGKAHISDGAMDTSLAGAVLGELVLADLVGIGEGTQVVPLREGMTGDQVCDTALAQIQQQDQQHPVRAWTEHLRDGCRPLVAQRLVRVGLIERVESRVMLRTTLRYPARDRIAAAAPIARLRYTLDNPSNLDERTAALAGLVVASGLEFVFGGASPREVRQGLVQMAQALRPELALLVAGVQSAVAALALSARR